MISVGVSGAPGRMGRFTLGALAPLDDIAVGGLYAPGHGGEDIAGHTCSGDPEALRGCDVILEFTNPAVAPANVRRWRSFDSHVVIGTSGYDTDRVAALESEWAGSARRCLVVPNFSLGAVVMTRLAELAAPHFSAAEIVELHHDGKLDAPSGTALNMAARMGGARRDAGIGPTFRGNETAPGALGAEVEGIPIHSVRAPGMLAHHEVIFGGVGEYLTVRHDTTDNAAYAPMIILALRSVGQLEAPVTVGLEALIGL